MKSLLCICEPFAATELLTLNRPFSVAFLILSVKEMKVASGA